MNKLLPVAISSDLHRKLKILAAKRNKTMTDLVRESMEAAYPQIAEKMPGGPKVKKIPKKTKGDPSKKKSALCKHGFASGLCKYGC